MTDWVTGTKSETGHTVCLSNPVGQPTIGVSITGGKSQAGQLVKSCQVKRRTCCTALSCWWRGEPTYPSPMSNEAKAVADERLEAYDRHKHLPTPQCRPGHVSVKHLQSYKCTTLHRYFVECTRLNRQQ